MSGKYIIILILLVLLVIFLIQNSSPMHIKFLLFTVNTSTAAMILFSAVLGIVIGSILAYNQKKTTQQKK